MQKSNPRGFILYKFYAIDAAGNDVLLYIGRTKQPLQNRIRGHLFKKPMHRCIDINQVSRIEYAMFLTEADMNLYEIYLINFLKPPLNVDDKTEDELTFRLPDVDFMPYTTPLWDRWKRELEEKDAYYNDARARLRKIEEDGRVLRKNWRADGLSEEDYYKRHDEFATIAAELRKKLYR